MFFPQCLSSAQNVPTSEQMQSKRNYVADPPENIHSSRCGAWWLCCAIISSKSHTICCIFASTLAGIQNRKCFDVWSLSGWGLSWEGEFHKANSMTVPGLSWRDLKCCLCRQCTEVRLNPCLKPVFLGAFIEKLWSLWLTGQWGSSFRFLDSLGVQANVSSFVLPLGQNVQVYL